MACMSLDAATLLEDLEKSSTLSLVCEPPQSPSPLLDDARPSSQVHPGYYLSDASAGIQISSLVYSESYLPNTPNTIFVCLRIEDDYTGVPNTLRSKALLWCDDPPTTPHITTGTWLETGSIYPVNDGMSREVVACVGVKDGHAVMEVAMFCDGACGKVRVWEKASFLVSFPAEVVDMPVVKAPLRQVLWNFIASCLQCAWCR